MDVTFKYTKPSPFIAATCTRCEEDIDSNEVYKFVQMSIGKTRFSFHEDCFQGIMIGMVEFYKVFLRDQKAEELEAVH